ncbi:CBS domain-containing protein [Elioraea thermophila]|uniref:CBS domain-containing protein n=1 Tax=Elioraea thermophila TaxID=2185104 RepID=UPI000DF15ABE|nr:CBS domain-containing protein [Elioraea thermophila]
MLVETILKEKGREVVSVAPTTPVAEAAKILSARRIGSVLVRDDGGGIAGILSERDIVRGIADHGAASIAMPVSALMTRDVVFASPADTLDAVLAVMTERRFRHLPVLENGRLVGLVSIGDVVKRKIEEVTEEAEGLRAFVQGAG